MCWIKSLMLKYRIPFYHILIGNIWIIEICDNYKWFRFKYHQLFLFKLYSRLFFIKIKYFQNPFYFEILNIQRFLKTVKTWYILILITKKMNNQQCEMFCIYIFNFNLKKKKYFCIIITYFNFRFRKVNNIYLYICFYI